MPDGLHGESSRFGDRRWFDASRPQGRSSETSVQYSSPAAEKFLTRRIATNAGETTCRGFESRQLHLRLLWGCSSVGRAAFRQPLSLRYWKNGEVNANQDYIGQARKGELVRIQPVREGRVLPNLSLRLTIDRLRGECRRNYIGSDGCRCKSRPGATWVAQQIEHRARFSNRCRLEGRFSVCSG